MRRAKPDDPLSTDNANLPDDGLTEHASPHLLYPDSRPCPNVTGQKVYADDPHYPAHELLPPKDLTDNREGKILPIFQPTDEGHELPYCPSN